MNSKDQTYDIDQMDTKLRSAAIEPLVQLDEDRAKASPRVRRLLDGIKSHFLDPSLNVGRLLKIAGIASGSIEADFHNDTGQSILSYIQKCRLEVALMLLLDLQLEITEIAHLAGFSGRFHFNRIVRRRFGMSPQEIRERWQVVLSKTTPPHAVHTWKFWLDLQRGELKGKVGPEIRSFFDDIYPRHARVKSHRYINPTYSATLRPLLEAI